MARRASDRTLVASLVAALLLVTSSKAFAPPAAPVSHGLRAAPPPKTVMMNTVNRAIVETTGSVAKTVAQQLKEAPADDDEEKAQAEGTADGITSAIDSLLGFVEDAIEAEKAQVLRYTTYPPYPEDPTYDLSGMMPMLDGPPPFSMWFAPSKLVRLVWRLVQSVFAKYAPKLTGDRFMKVFGNVFMQATPITNNDLWETDKGFAQQFLSGTNPVMLRRVKSVKDELTKNRGEAIVKALGESSLESLAKDGNLYCVTYDAWDSEKTSPRKVLSKNDSWPLFYFYNPIVVFSVPEGDSKLMPLAIQIERTKDAKVYKPGDKEWTFAKMIVASADENVHEWLSHLGKTHLTVEPQIIAAINQLKDFKHPLYAFLEPHYKDTLFLSWAARLTLLYYEPPAEPIDPAQALEAAKNSSSVADTEFAVGAANFLKVLLAYWKDFTFDQSAFDTELKNRGFDDLEHPGIPNYFYLEDGLKLWKAIGEYTTGFVDSIYADDLALKNDARLQAWAAEVADPARANIKGFPSPMPDKPTLARCLQTTIWVATGLHAAVNFPQFDYMAYQPNRPAAFLKPVADAENDLEWVFQNAVSTKAIAGSIAQTVWLLTMPSDHTLGDLTEPLGTAWEDAYGAFKTKLAAISTEINERNAALVDTDTPFPYTYLDPPNVPASIDI